MKRQDISKWKAISRAIISGKASYRALQAAEKATKRNLSTNMLEVAKELSTIGGWEARRAHLAMLEAYTSLMKSKGYVRAAKDRQGVEVYIDKSKLRELMLLDEDIALRIAEIKDLLSKGVPIKKVIPLAESLLKLIKKRDGGRRVRKTTKRAQEF